MAKISVFLVLFMCFFNAAIAEKVKKEAIKPEIKKEVKQEDLIIEIKNGLIQGEEFRTFGGRAFIAYRGIPYAEPPIEEARFKPPKPKENWKAIINATKDGHICPQLNMASGQVIGSEDCLFVNVYTPKLTGKARSSDDRIPVMVFFHGGAFLMGSANFPYYGPQRLLDRDIVLVTLNYRIGALGFLSTEDEVLPGNYGLHDQLAALQWVKDNIEFFGGDPERVTIFGASAGSSSVLLHVLSPLSKDLFQYAIAQSGSPICDWGINENPLRTARKLAFLLNCKAYPSKEIADCLRTKTSKEILEASKKFSYVGFFPLVFVPTVDNVVGGFMPEHPKTLLQEGRYNKVPIIIGQNKDEAVGFALLFEKAFGRTGETYIQNDLPEVISIITDISEQRAKDSLDVLRKTYFTDEEIEKDPKKFSKSLFNLFNDALFVSCIDKTVELLSKHDSSVYAYKLTHRGQFSLSEYFGVQQNVGVIHGDEIQYLFESATYSQGLKSIKDTDLSSTIISLWSNFTHYGEPTKAVGDKEPPFVWLPTDAKTPRFLDLNSNSSMTEGRLSENTELWTSQLTSSGEKSKRRDEL